MGKSTGTLLTCTIRPVISVMLCLVLVLFIAHSPIPDYWYSLIPSTFREPFGPSFFELSVLSCFVGPSHRQSQVISHPPFTGSVLIFLTSRFLSLFGTTCQKLWDCRSLTPHVAGFVIFRDLPGEKVRAKGDASISEEKRING